MTIKIGINGMGRIGRMVLRSIIESKNKKIEIKHINNRTGPEVCSGLIKYDSVHGKFNSEIKFDDDNLIINNKKITFSRETDINKMTIEKAVSLFSKKSKVKPKTKK